MKRRGFFGSLLAAFAGLFAIRNRNAFAMTTTEYRNVVGVQGLRYDPTIAERDQVGNCLSRPYRRGEDGCFHEIGRMDAKPGDYIIMLGIDGKRLWMARAITVGERGSFKLENGQEALEIGGAEQNLMIRVPAVSQSPSSVPSGLCGVVQVS